MSSRIDLRVMSGADFAAKQTLKRKALFSDDA